MRDELVPIVEANGGVFNRRQALSAGYTRAAVDHLLETGQWVALRSGVYVERQVYEPLPADHPRRHHLEVAAALLSLRKGDAVASHHSAARLHELTLLEPPPPLVVVTRPPGAPGRDRLRGVHVHRAALPEAHVTTRQGVRLTSIARTAVDIARTLPFREALVTVDAALHTRKVEREDLRMVLEVCGRWPGGARAMAVVDFADPNAESALESLARLMFHEQGLPRPRTQVQVGGFARVDFLWWEHRTIVEVDGLVKYRDSEDALRREKLRQERLERMGFTVVRLGWSDVVHEPLGSAERIRRAFAARRL